jgi:hypothetical protein
MRWPEPTTDEPTIETITEWVGEGGTYATDGCWLAQDTEACEHGHPSWAIVLGLAPDLHGD